MGIYVVSESTVVLVFLKVEDVREKEKDLGDDDGVAVAPDGCNGGVCEGCHGLQNSTDP
jgi:hypothetical protein